MTATDTKTEVVISDNGYATLEDLQALEGKRLYRDVTVPNPFTPGKILKFRIRTLVEEEWSEISTGNLDLRKGGLSDAGMKASDSRLVAISLVDGDGNMLYSGDTGHERIRRLPTAIVEPLVRECRQLNNLRQADDEDQEGN